MVTDIRDKHVVFLGCGAVAKCVLSLLENFFILNPRHVLIVDRLNYKSHPDVKKWLKRGAAYDMLDINEVYEHLFDSLTAGDLVIDLTSRTESTDLIHACKVRNLHYLNTSMEDIETINQQRRRKYSTYDMSYTGTHQQLKEMNVTYPTQTATMVVEMGMNPGLVSLMAKLAISKMAHEAAIKAPSHAKAAEALKVDVIHISETDSTEFTGPRRPAADVFCNTWCCNGLNDEYAHDAEFSFGTHEKKLPTRASIMLSDVVVDAETPAYNCYTQSYVPGETFTGCLIPHGEGISLGEFLKTPRYHPTVHYVYRWSPVTQACLKKHTASIGDTFAKTHVVNNYEDDFYGVDKVGTLLLTGNKKAFWCGSILDNSDVGRHSGTIQQVAAGVLVGLMHIVRNPTQGIVFPEAIDESMLLEVESLLGTLFCGFVDYTRSTQFSTTPKTSFDRQFYI